MHDYSIPLGLKHMTRASWREFHDDGSHTPWPEAVDQWAHSRAGRTLVLCGKTGVGKTHIGVALLREFGGKFVSAIDLHHENDSAFARWKDDEDNFLGWPILVGALDAPMVMADDVAWNGNLGDLESGAVARLIHFSQRLIIATHFLPENLGTSPWIAHLIATSTVVVLEGPDRRGVS